MTERVPAQFRAEVVRRLGHGGEAIVYELTGGRALRVYHKTPHGAGEIAAFYRAISQGRTSFALPQILEQGERDGVFYSVDRLIAGRPLHELMPHLVGDERRAALASYTDAVFEIATLPMGREAYGELLRDDDSIQAGSWNAYLLARMERSLGASPWLRDDVPGLDEIVGELRRRIAEMAPAAKALVHGDYFPGNVLMSDALAVAGVIDFGPLTLIGDAWLDLASAVIFLEVARPGYSPEDTELVQERLLRIAGPGILPAITTYRGWYAIRFSPYRDDDPKLYAWCVGSLRRLRDELRL